MYFWILLLIGREGNCVTECEEWVSTLGYAAETVLQSFAHRHLVSLLLSFPETPTCVLFPQWFLHITHPFALYTHNAIGFVLNLCAACVQRCVCSVGYYSKIMVEQLLHITLEYEERLRGCQYVPRFSFGC